MVYTRTKHNKEALEIYVWARTIFKVCISRAPMVAYTRQTNIREAIFRVKLAPEGQKRIQKGGKKCGHFLACSYIKEGKYILGRDYEGRKFKWTIGRPISCDSTNIVYLLECDKEYCKQNNIGITHQELRERIYQQVGYVRNKHINRATGLVNILTDLDME